MSYLLTLTKNQLLTVLILDATITTATSGVKNTTAIVLINYYLWKKSANKVMKFLEWIKYILKIDKSLAQRMKTHPKRKKAEEQT